MARKCSCGLQNRERARRCQLNGEVRGVFKDGVTGNEITLYMCGVHANMIFKNGGKAKIVHEGVVPKYPHVANGTWERVSESQR